jgi:glutathione S-transferase
VKLYYSPGACSLCPHIVLREAGLSFDLERVDLKTHQIQGAVDFYKLNPKGYVPMIELDDGQRLTENVAITQYLADRAPEKKLAPANGTMERYRLIEWLAFVTSEVHKGFSPLFSPKLSDDTKQFFRDKLATRFELLDKHLQGKTYLMGDTFTVADAYLFTVLRWTVPLKVDIAKWTNLKAYFSRVHERPAVMAALEAEGQK